MRIFRIQKMALRFDMPFDSMVIVHRLQDGTPVEFKAMVLPSRANDETKVLVRNYQTREKMFVNRDDCTTDESWEKRRDEIWNQREVKDFDKYHRPGAAPEWAHPDPQGF